MRGAANVCRCAVFWKNAGYNITQNIGGPKDVVLPTAGIEDWIEIHNAPAETEKLAELLPHLKGVDIVAARLPEPTNHFLVLNSKGDEALVQWNPTNNTFKYSAEKRGLRSIIFPWWNPSRGKKNWMPTVLRRRMIG